MKTEIESYTKTAKQLQIDYPKLTEFERLSLAIQIERNQILENGLNVSTTDKYPASLEAIAIALGYTGEQLQSTITDVIKEIANKE